MSKHFSLLLTLALLTGAALGEVRVSEDYEPASMPRVALCGDQYFVVWVHSSGSPAEYNIYAARVDADLSEVHETFPVYDCGYEQVADLEVASKADTMLVVFDKVSGVAERHIYGAVIYPGDDVWWRGQISSPMSARDFTEPTVASCADSFLVAYNDVENTTVRGDGVYAYDDPLRGGDFEIQDDAEGPSLASDGADFFLVYVHTTSDAVMGRHVDDDQQTPFTIYDDEDSDGQPAVTCMADSGTFLAAFRALIVGEHTLMVRQTTLTEALGDGEAVVCTGVSEAYYAAATSDINFGVVWQQDTEWDYVAAQRVNTGCALVGPREVVAEEEQNKFSLDPHAASDGEYFGFVWQEQTPSHSYIKLDTLSCWQRHFYVRNMVATSHNNGRHLALDPETGWLHRVYFQTGLGEPPVDSIMYTYSTDKGYCWFPYEYLGPGNHPCVVCEGQDGDNPVWVCYVVYEDSDDDTLKVLAREGPGDWEVFAIPFSGLDKSPPSMAMAYDQDQPKVYVASRMFDDTEDKIICYPVLLYSGVGKAEEVSTGGVSEDDIPSLATTPGDIVHCVWGVGHYYDEGHEIYYRRRVDEEWEPETPQVVSGPGQNNSLNPCVEQDGDNVYAVYSEDFEAHDVWWAERDLSPLGDWKGHENQSNSPPPPPESKYPQNSTRMATMWLENSEILLWLVGEVHSFASAEEIDRPHMVVVLNDPEEQENTVLVYGTWTEGVAENLYEVMFDCKDYQIEEDGALDFPFYDARVGDSVQSRYCLARDGYARWRGFSVDYGRERLSYRLPYLNPHCIYRLRAVLYHASRNTWEQSFGFDGRPAARVSYKPMQAETVLVTIPRDLYRRDFSVDLDIARLSGDYASVAELKLYEVYPFLERGGYDLELPVPESVSRLLEVAGANPFRSQARIAYSVPTAQRVTVRVYDVQGRVVSELASGPHALGEYSVSWNGTDSQGRQVAAGAYYIELRTESSGTTRKLVYAP